MRELTEAEKQAIWDDVRREFPDDEMMQQIHYVRQLHYFQMKEMTNEEKLQFYSQERQKKSA